MRPEFQVGRTKEVLEMDGGDGCVPLGMYLNVTELYFSGQNDEVYVGFILPQFLEVHQKISTNKNRCPHGTFSLMHRRSSNVTPRFAFT